MSGFTHAVNTGSACQRSPDRRRTACKGKTLPKLKTGNPAAGIMGSGPE
jgi:hypothetical protein